MNRFLTLLLGSFVLFVFAGCANSDELDEVLENETQMEAEETAFVELAEEGIFSLEASAMSEGGSFAYTVHYDGNQFAYVDDRFNPNFRMGLNMKADTRAELISIATPVGEVPQIDLAPKDEAGLVCTVEHRSRDYLDETLHFFLTVCPGEEADWLVPAFQSLVDSTEFEALL